MEGAAAAFSVAKTSVWWDIENCRPPSDVNPFDIARNISNCLHAFKFVGPLNISAYGDTYQLSRHVQNALTSTGITLNHIPSGRKEASDKAIVMNMAFWTNDNPPPANVLLITGDQDFSPLLHRLQMKRFNVLLARPEGVHVSESLLNSANTVWYWSRLARAEVNSLAFPRDTRTKSPVEPMGFDPRAVNSNVFSPGPIARPPAPPPFRSPPVHAHEELVFPGLRQHPPPPPPPQHHLQQQQQQQQHFQRHAVVPPPPPAQVQQEFSPAPRPLFLQWPASPQCFSGVSDSAGGMRQQQWSGGDKREYFQARPVIRKALETLSREMMLPTESNIYNCIVFGQKCSLNFNLFAALEQGVKVGELVLKSAGAGDAEKIFLPAGIELWTYVDPNICREYDADIWNDLRNFLCGEDVHAFVNSANHYHAALVLRGRGLGRLSDMALAQIYNVIQLAILVRLWIKPHRNWSPLTITISRSDPGGSACTAVVEEKVVDVVHQSAASQDGVDHFERTAFDVVNKVLEEPSLFVDNSVVFPEPATDLKVKTQTTDNRAPTPTRSSPVKAKQESVNGNKAVADKVSVKEVTVTKAKKEKPVSIIKELRAWLPSMLSADGYDISLVRQDFKAARGINLDHQALGYPKLLDIMRKISDVVQVSSPRPGLCKLYPPGTVVVQEKSREKVTPAETLDKLKAWLPTLISKRGVCDLTSVCKEFEKDCRIKLVPSALGFPSISKLLEQYSDIVRLESLQSGDVVLTSVKKVPPQKEVAVPEQVPAADVSSGDTDLITKMTEECKALLLESIPRCKAGYPVARLKEDFQQRYGYTLDHAGCGYKKLETFLERMTDRVGIKAGSGGHKLLYVKEIVEPYSDPAPADAKPVPESKNSKKPKKPEADMNKQEQQGSVPLCIRYGYVERVAESRFPIKPSHPLCMID